MTHHRPARRDVEAYYDARVSRLVRDVIDGNRRVDRQLKMLSSAVPRTVRAVLVVGCGAGQATWHIAGHAPQAVITGVDISADTVRLAQALFPHPRIRYRVLDVTVDAIDGSFDVIVLPDVYEHVAPESRVSLHARLDRLLAADGRIVMTMPSAAHQSRLREEGVGLQIIDETITVDDLQALASDVHGVLTHCIAVSVWDAHDYVHAVIERGGDRERWLTGRDGLPVAEGPAALRLARAESTLSTVTGWSALCRWWRRRRVARALSATAASRADARCHE